MGETTTNLLTTLGSVLTDIWGWLTSVITLAGNQPILLVPCGIGVAGALVGLFKRSVKVGGRGRR